MKIKALTNRIYIGIHIRIYAFKDTMMKNSDEIFRLHADFCKVISEPKRLRIIELLAKREMSVGDISVALNTSSSNISQHLRVLRAKSVVETRKKGQTVLYRLVDKRLPKICVEIRTVLLDIMKKRGEIAHGVSSTKK